VTPSTFGCVCATESHWRCGVHGKITPEKRAAARYGRECANWTEPVEVHPDQETLV
jgi:hypothetical protein